MEWLDNVEYNATFLNITVQQVEQHCNIIIMDVMTAGKEISEEESSYSLTPSSTNVAGRLEQLSTSTQAHSVCMRDEVDSRYTSSSSSRMDLAEAVWMSSYDCSRDINELVFCGRGFVRSSRQSREYVDYYFHLLKTACG